MLRLRNFDDYSPRDIAWLISKLTIFDWTIDRDGDTYTCYVGKSHWPVWGVKENDDLCEAIELAYNDAVGLMDGTSKMVVEPLTLSESL